MAETQRPVAVVVFSRPGDFDRKSVPLGVARACERATLAAARGADADVIVLGDLDVPTPRTAHHLEQRGDSFEARLLDGLERVKALGYERVVVVGTDTPEMSAADVRRAVAERKPVFGPAVDGGVYLIGLEVGALHQLRRLPWGTPALGATLASRFPAPSRLRMLGDVDDAKDARAAARTLSSRVLAPANLVITERAAMPMTAGARRR